MGFDSKESIVSELVGAIEEEQRAEVEMNRYYPGDDYPEKYRKAKYVWQEAQKYRKSCEKAIADWDKPAPMPRAHGSKLIMPGSKEAAWRDAVSAAKAAGKAYAKLQAKLDEGVRRYGMNGGLISGGFYPNWPEALKDDIRALWRLIKQRDDACLAAYKQSGKRKHIKDTELAKLCRNEK